MAIRAGQILTDVHGFVVDRLQTTGVNNVNIPLETVRETGNFLTVATIRDVPDLTFEMESLDVSTELEAILTGQDPTQLPDGWRLDFQYSLPLDVVSPFKSSFGQFDIFKGVAIPYLTLENVTYRFGVRANATQTFSLRGDAIYYVPGTPYYQQFNLAGTGPYQTAHTPIAYVEAGVTHYALGVCLRNPTTGAYKRLFKTADYTETSGGAITLNTAPAATYTRLGVVYGSTATAYYPQTVHQDASVKPAAVRAKDIDVYVGTPSGLTATPTFVRWPGVQSFEATRRVTLENDDEFGNYHYVETTYDTAEVTGNIVVRSFDLTDLFTKIAQVTNTATNVVSSTFTSQPVSLEIRINNPDTGTVIKSIYIPDARFTPPGIQARVNTKIDTTFPFQSDSGTMWVYKGQSGL